MERREVFRILGAAAAATTCSAQQQPDEYQPRFFSPGQYADLQQICATMIPADDEGGGAVEAGVPFYLDTMMLHADTQSQSIWRTALDSGRLEGFAKLQPADRESVLRELEADGFFTRLKYAIIDGFCQSKTGMDYLGYKGNHGSLSFAGCTHTEHQS